MNIARGAASAGLLGVIAAAAVQLAAQAPQPVQPPPVFRSATDIVEVDVTVEDRTGRFIDDLAATDFEVQEDGRPQAIALFGLVGSGRSAVAAAPPATAGAAAPGVVSPRPRVFVVVFDDEHLTPGGFKRVQAAAESLFAKQFQPGDIGGVVADGKMANGRLTTDREELLAAVHAARPNSKTDSRLADERQWPRLSEIEAIRIAIDNDQNLLTEAATRACNEDIDACGPRGKADPIDQAKLFLASKAATLTANAEAASNLSLQRVAAVLNGLSRIAGRKTVVLLSDGFVARQMWPVVQQTVRLAARADARIYTLDARSLDRGLSARLLGSNPGANDAGARLLEQLDFGSDPIDSLAADTGGFTVRNTNVFDQAIARIAADAGTYYLLGYRPDTPPDGKFRRISVNIHRAEAVVRARRGYVADAAIKTVRLKPETTSDMVTLKPDTLDAVRLKSDTSGETIRPKPATTDATSSQPESTASGTVVAPPAPAASAARLRPDSVQHTEQLVQGVRSSDAAAAGWDAYQRGDLEAARAGLAGAAASPEARPWVHYALGQSQYALRDFSGAIASWEYVRAAVADFEPVYFDLVDGYLQTHDYDKAIRVLRNAAEKWPTDHEVYGALGVVQVARGVFDDAVKSFEEAIALAPADATGYFNLAKTLELRYRKSRRFVEQTRTWVANEGDRANAIANYRRYLEIGGPLDNSAREGLSRLAWK